MSSQVTNADHLRHASQFGRIGDKVFKGVTLFFSGLVLFTLLAILLLLLKDAWPVFHTFGFKFIYDPNWDVVNDKYGALAPIVGTLTTSFIAVLIGVPVSFGIAIFITLMAPEWLKRPVGIAIELLAAVPSIIYGMWGLFYFAPWFSQTIQPFMTNALGDLPWIGQFFQGPPIGIGVFTAAIVLAIMIIPFISSIMRDLFEVVPTALKESAFAMGSTTWEVVWKVVLPYTKAGVIGGAILGLGRALGETMAVAFVVGNSLELNAGLFYPGATIASTMANEFNEASGMHKSALIGLALMLFVITFVVLVIAKMFLMQLDKKHSGTKT